MAIRERKGKPHPWQTYWNNPITGKRESASFETRLEAEKHDSLIKHRIKFERESFRPEAQERKEELTFEQAYLLYLQEKQFSRKAMTLQVRVMRSLLQKWAAMPLAELNPEEMLAVISKPIRNGEIAQTTIFRMWTLVKAFFRWCAEHELFELPKLPKVQRGQCEKFIPPTVDEIQRILDTASPHLQRVIILGSQTGARIGSCELLQLTWNDVDFSRCVIRIHGAKKNVNAPWREVPLRESLMQLMAAWALEDKAAGMDHIIHYEGKPIRSIRSAWRNTLRRAGITRKIRPYDLRHAFATELIAAGADIGTVASLMGHSNPVMLLRHYQYVMDKQKKAAIDALPEIAHVPTPCVPKNQYG